jgi:hypothetical protein
VFGGLLGFTNSGVSRTPTREVPASRFPTSYDRIRRDMHDTLTTPLPAAWLASRLRLDADEIEKFRERGELFAVRPNDQGEWLYPAWQFGPRGTIPQGVRDAVRAARAVGLGEERLIALLRRRVGLMGGGRLLDLLFEGRSDTVINAIHASAATAS